MNSTKKAARIAGLLYFLSSLPAPLSLIYIPSHLVVPGDAAATANKIRSSELLFRVGIVGQLVSAAIFIFAGLAFYHLLKGVNKKHALAMLILVLVSVPISYLNELNRIAAVGLVSGGHFLGALDQREVDALLMTFLRLHGGGLNLAQIFWGLWLFPFGILVFKSGFLPRILGVLLVIACFGYVASSLTWLLFPAHEAFVFKFAAVAAGAGEGGTMLWLLIRGAKDQPLVASA